MPFLSKSYILQQVPYTSIYTYSIYIYTYRWDEREKEEVEEPDHLLDDGEREIEVSDGESALVGLRNVVVFRAKKLKKRNLEIEREKEEEDDENLELRSCDGSGFL